MNLLRWLWLAINSLALPAYIWKTFFCELNYAAHIRFTVREKRGQRLSGSTIRLRSPPAVLRLRVVRTLHPSAKRLETKNKTNSAACVHIQTPPTKFQIYTFPHSMKRWSLKETKKCSHQLRSSSVRQVCYVSSSRLVTCGRQLFVNAHTRSCVCVVK